MKIEITAAGVLLFFKKNWFKITLLILGLYVFFKKDFNFQIHVDAPDKTEQNSSRKSRDKITDNSPALSTNASSSKLEIPFIGGRRNGRDALGELASIDESTRQSYLKRFVDVARTEQKKIGIPASVILATALHQSCAGKRDLTLTDNNHFALICDGNWSGRCVDNQNLRYRSYESAWFSFRDFSLFAKENFSSLKGQDYKAWARGMGQAGFSGDENFARNLVQIIEAYGLEKLDK